MRRLFLSIAVAAVVACVPSSERDRAREIERLLAEQSAAWSRGDLDAFCSDYAEDAIFLTPSGVTQGREFVLERYRNKYPDASAMGTLALEPIETRVLGDVASVAARWTLSYPDRPEATGLTLIVFHHRGGRWELVQDASM